MGCLKEKLKQDIR